MLADTQPRDVTQTPFAELRAAGVEFLFGAQDSGLLDGADIIVPSPAISPEIPLLQDAVRRRIPVWSEVEVACRVTDAAILAVTGTNGKTTTTTLLGEMVKASGRQTAVGGNIGVGLAQAVTDLPPQAVAVAELSSFQLELTSSLHAVGAVILNITPDHLDRHHTMEAYSAAKERIFSNQEATDTAVLNYDDDRVRNMQARRKGKVVFFSTQGEVPEGAFYKDHQLMLRHDGTDTLICRDSDLQLFGAHNIQNCLAAVLLATAVAIPLPVIRSVLKRFRGVEHLSLIHI